MASGICPLGWRKVIEFYYCSRSRCLNALVFLKSYADYLIRAKSLSDCVVVLNLLEDFALDDQHVAWLIFDGWLESLDFCLKLEITGQRNIFFWLCEVCVKFGSLKLLGVLCGSWLIVYNYFWVLGLACLASEAGSALGEIFSITLNTTRLRCEQGRRILYHKPSLHARSCLHLGCFRSSLSCFLVVSSRSRCSPCNWCKSHRLRCVSATKIIIIHDP